MKRIGLITSGGDCAGLNAVLKGAAIAARKNGISCFVIPNGYAGLYNLIGFERLVELTPERLMEIDAFVAGSEAGHSRVKISEIADPKKYDRIREGLSKFALEGLVVSGGDDTGSVIVDLADHGVRCVHAPKTMDLDLQTYSVGAASAIDRIATFARDLRTTGRTHNRIIVMEVFGRYAGHTAFRGGIAAEADAILIPEIQVDFDILYPHMKRVYSNRLKASDVCAATYLVVVAEGIRDAQGNEIVDDSAGEDSFKHKRLSGAGEYVRDALTERLREDGEITDLMRGQGVFVQGIYEEPEVRSVRTGHLVRCGHTSTYDVSFGLEVGAGAVYALLHGLDSVTIAGVHGNEIRYMKTSEAIRQRHVDLKQVAYHENLGVCFGRRPEELALEFVPLSSAPERPF